MCDQSLPSDAWVSALGAVSKKERWQWADDSHLSGLGKARELVVPQLFWQPSPHAAFLRENVWSRGSRLLSGV